MAEPNNRPNISPAQFRGGPGGPMGRPGGPGGPRGPRGMPLVVEKPKDARKTIGRLLKYIGKNKYLLISMLVIVIFSSALTLLAPTLQGEAIDAITITEQKLSVDFKRLMLLLVALLVVYLSSSLLTYVQMRISIKLSQSTVHTMRADLFAKLEHLPIKYFDTHKHGDIMSRMTNDVENISNTVSTSISSLFSGALTLTGCLVVMLIRSPLLTLVSLVTIPLTILVSTKLSKFMRKLFIKQQALLGSLNGHIEENVTGYKTLAAFSREQECNKEFANISNELKSCGVKANAIGGVMGPLMNVIGNLNFLLIAAFGGYLAFNGLITVGIIQAFLSYSKQFTRPINELAHQYAAILTAIAGADRVFAVMDNPPEADEGTTSLDIDHLRGDLSFKDVVFSYKDGEPVLKGFNLEVKGGQKIAIVGATGAGKTTVVNLLTRFYDIDSGSISLDGVDITDIPKDQLRKCISIVLQDTILFSGTIAENIRYGKLDASDEEIARAAAISNSDVFIEKLPDGYNSLLSESGGNLSQGQRQLLSIARAALADPKILILDEATSSVDTRTEMHIQNAMIELMKGRTSLIIAHRLSTIRDADKIIVIDGGVIVEEGGHEELLAKKGRYYSLYQSQFAGIAT